MEQQGLTEFDDDARTITFRFSDSVEVHEYEDDEEYYEAVEFLMVERGFAFFPDVPEFGSN